MPTIPKLKRAQFLGQRWDLPDVGKVTAVEPTADLLAQADRVWPEFRRESDLHRHWVWSDLMGPMEDRFALVDSGGQVVSLWCSLKKRPIKLIEGTFYRLEYVEIDPRHRGSSLGGFTVGLAAARAVEAGCDGLVLAALPTDGLKRVYERLGGVQRLPYRWQIARELIPFVFPQDAITKLKDLTDGFIDEEEEEGGVHGDDPTGRTAPDLCSGIGRTP
ncbi:GNAT family N-acetyltransferase [Sorangium sp. KYC3313]|uniref:GNAT family N-acetyltransferase n=1 Tax=Sorangium sp. KYC3313 TaxID=3449740 RepID=UPI003F8A0FED